MGKKQQQFSVLCQFIVPPPTEEQIKKAKEESEGQADINSDKNPIKRGLLKL